MKPWLLCALSVTACVSDSNEDLGADDLVDEALGEIMGDGTRLNNNEHFPNAAGQSATWSTAGSVDLTNTFFHELGTNGRHCGHCHAPGQGWVITPASTQAVFDRTDGLDPIFRAGDGACAPTADVSTLEARRTAYRMLLARGVFRVGIGIPPDAEFELIAIDDPYGYASAAELSLFRRPLPSANLTLISNVMWDGRHAGVTIDAALADQSNGATQGHAEAPDPIAQSTRDAIVGFETGLYNAQLVVYGVGRLDRHGARGGAEALATQPFVAGRFNLYDAYATSGNPQRRAIYRGQELFNTRTRPDGRGPCGGCHSTENVGTNRNGVFFNIGTASGARRTADLPLYTMRRISNGDLITTTDPGRALITGKWSDMNRFKTPSLRGLAARPPYFHDGSAATLADVIATYEELMGFDFTAAEEGDLVAFLSAL